MQLATAPLATGVFVVSIPNRDFDELQFLALSQSDMQLPLSIPNRDFDELQWCCYCSTSRGRCFQSLIGILMNCNCQILFLIHTQKRFQSLIGILMNCNVSNFQATVKDRSLSIPNRDFDDLQ